MKNFEHENFPNYGKLNGANRGFQHLVTYNSFTSILQIMSDNF